MRTYILKKTKAEVIARAGSKCEYCKFHQEHSFLPFQIEHVISLKHGGGSEIENLALACSHCNSYKGTDLTTFLDSYDDIVPIFNPRKEDWLVHFEAKDGLIIPKTRTGKATIKLLRLNEAERLAIRKVLADVGLYP